MQTAVYYQYAAGLPGEFINDGPNRTQSFRLVANTAQTPSPAIAFGVAYTYAAAGASINPDNLAGVDTATPGGASLTSVFAGILVNPKEHALVGDANGALDPVFQLPNGSWGELARMGILLAGVTSGGASGNSGDALAFSIADGTLVAVAPGATLTATQIAIPGARLLSAIGNNASNVLARIELTTVGPAVIAG